MKRSSFLVLVLGFCLGSSALADPGLDPAQDAQSPKQTRCRESSLSGYYIYAQDGFTVSGNEATQRTPFAQTGREFYDGRGGVSGIYTASTNGKITRGRYHGTYAIDADCFGTVTFTDTAGQTFHYDIYLGDGGDEFSFIQTDTGVVSASYERRRAGSSSRN